MDQGYKYVIAGDLNTRFGGKVHELVTDDDSLTYTPVDKGENDNGKKVIGICKDQHLIVVNNLNTSSGKFTGALSYREGTE